MSWDHINTPDNYGSNHHAWKGDKARPKSIKQRGWVRCRRLYPINGQICEECGKAPATDHHHKDGNSGNNRRSNVILICHPCHSRIEYVNIYDKINSAASERMKRLWQDPEWIAKMEKKRDPATGRYF